MPRNLRTTFLFALRIAFDLGVLGLAFAFALVLRFEGETPAVIAVRLPASLLWVVCVQYLALSSVGFTRASWRFVSLHEALRAVVALAGAGVVLGVFRLVSVYTFSSLVWTEVFLVPLGVLGIDLLLACLGVVGARAFRRLLAEQVRAERRRNGSSQAKRTLLVGAGEAGVLIARDLLKQPQLNLQPVAFLDDDRSRHGQLVHGIPIKGLIDMLPAAATLVRADQVLLTIANAPGALIRRVRELSQQAGLPLKILPGLGELVGGQVTVSRLRSVAIEDLLRREPVKLDMSSISGFVRGKSVLVTGAGGSIGSELCRQLLGLGPAKLILVEQAENALFEIHRELLATATLGDDDLVPCLADVCDGVRLHSVFNELRPELVFHAAAHKHVPMLERHPGEAIKNNVRGTRTVADLAAEFSAEAFVLVSTDKAVNPTSVMGTTKRIAELYVQTLAARSTTTRFEAVRFGNVLGSAGSVVPIFKQQIAAGGPVTVTHKDMERFFMTIPEACQLILQASSMGTGGEVFVLDMGQPVRIAELAQDLIRLSGLEPGVDVEIVYTGLRPGEKLFEELSSEREQVDTTRHPRIFVGHASPPDAELLVEQIEGLLDAADREGPIELRSRLCRVVPEYSFEQPAAIGG